MSEAKRSDEIASLRAERDNLLWRNRLLRQRPDLPADRIPAHAEMERLQAEIERLREMLGAIAVTAEKVDGDPPPAVAALVIQAIARGARAALSGSSEGVDR